MPLGQSGALCEYAGHEWVPAGGGLLMCAECEAEKWATKSDPCGTCGAPSGEPCARWCPEGEGLDG